MRKRTDKLTECRTISHLAKDGRSNTRCVVDSFLEQNNERDRLWTIGFIIINDRIISKSSFVCRKAPNVSKTAW